MTSYKTTIAFLFISVFSLTSFSQSKLDDYKYVVISKQLDLKRKTNQFNINNLLKSHLNNKNFTAFIEGEYNPTSIKPCDILRAKINEEGFLTTRISITFTDCNLDTIYTTQEGVSRIKEFKPAYFEAFKNTLDDPNIKNHTFDEKKSTVENASEKKTKTVKKVFVLEFKGTQYTFNETNINNEFIITSKFKSIGTLKKKSDSDIYVLEANDISGTGTFDNYGNFNLTRINPANKATITDVMARVN